MKKSILFSICMIFIMTILSSGCSSFKETYRPLYQVEPIKEKLKEE